MTIVTTITRKQFFDFIKTEKDSDVVISAPTQHYLDFFDRYKKTGKKTSKNWASLIPFWWWYRRMYVIAITLFICKQLIGKICTGAAIQLEIALQILLIVFLMVHADYIYFQHACKKISEGTVKGGVNRTIVAVLIVFCVLVFRMSFY